jgi:hypothetical protein
MTGAPLPSLGMEANMVLRIPGRTREFAVAEPTYVGNDGTGMVWAWHYMDCDLILHYRDGAYRVREVLVRDIMSRLM